MPAVKPRQKIRHADGVYDVVHLPDRRIITCADDGPLRLWDLESGTQIGDDWRDGAGGLVLAIALSPNSETVAAASDGGTIRLWDVETGKVIARLTGHTGPVWSVRWSADGESVVSGSSDGTARVWDIKRRTVLRPIKTGHMEVYAVIYSPDTLKIATGGFNRDAVKIWDAKTGGLLSTIAHKTPVWSLAWTSDQGNLLSGSGDGLIRIFNTATWTCHEITRLEGHKGGISTISLFRSDRLLASASWDKTVRLWNLDTNRPVGPPLRHGDIVNRAAISTDGKLLVTGCDDDNAYVWDVHNVLRDASLEDLLYTHYTSVNTSATIPTNNSTLVPFNGLDQEAGESLMDVDDDPEEQGITRCICGQNEEDVHAGDFMVQCETCYVWQHGLCMGYRAEADLQDEYYCERCKPENHQELLKKVAKESRQSSGSSHHTASLNSHTLRLSKRITTMKSRDVAFDESGVRANEPILRDLSEYITKVGDYPVARGGFGEIWKCLYQTPGGSIEVAVKALLVYAADQIEGSVINEKKVKRIWRELETGAKLRHENILPMYGYTYGFGKFAAIVSLWAEKGSLLAYLEVENAALTPVRRFEILRDISAGLHYLHANDVVHGDLTGPNVLIHGDGTACLCDFGLSIVLSEVIGSFSVTSTLRGNCRWMAPELLNVHENEPLPLPSKISDIYSFGGIMLHVLTGQVPYYYLRNEAQVIHSIITRVNPYRSRYSPVADKYWYFIEQCWETVTQDRPSAGQVVHVINAELYFMSVIEPRQSTHNAASSTS